MVNDTSGSSELHSSSQMVSDTSGLWEPHTSSIDFCESNYLHTPAIVEVHNTWSSIIGITSFGVIGLLHCYKSKNSTNYHYKTIIAAKRNIIAYLILIFIGLGSACLHGTLHWIFQSSDELPMIYLTNCILYMCAEYDAPLPSSHTTISSQHQAKLNYKYLPLIMVLESVILTVGYYFFQQIYAVFLCLYGIQAMICIYWIYRIVKKQQTKLSIKNKSQSTQKQTKTASAHLLKMLVICYLFIAFPMWVFDMHYCSQVLMVADHHLPGILRGATPHIIWHFCAGISGYAAIVCLSCARMEEMDVPMKLRYLFGFVPILVPVDNNDNPREGKKM